MYFHNCISSRIPYLPSPDFPENCMILILLQLSPVCAGCPSSMDALVAFDEDTLIAGSQDGLIRLLSVQPDKVIGALPNSDELPIEGLALSGKQVTALAGLCRDHHLCKYTPMH